MSISTGGSSAANTSLSRHMNKSIDSSGSMSDLSSRFSDVSDVLPPFEARQELEERIKNFIHIFHKKTLLIQLIAITKPLTRGQLRPILCKIFSGVQQMLC